MPSARRPFSDPSESNLRRRRPSSPLPIFRVARAPVMPSVPQRAPSGRRLTRSFPLLHMADQALSPTAVTPRVVLTIGAADPRRPACHRRRNSRRGR